MSKPIRIAAAVEGPTDTIVIEAILSALLSDADFEFHRLQPDESIALSSGSFGGTGGGWVGVYKWIRQSVSEGEGCISGSSVLSNHDILVVHLDADVAGKTYESGNIADPGTNDLPCEKPCPPPQATTDALREVILGWLGEKQCPSRVVLCTPSKNMEAWVVAAVWLDNPVILKGDWECHSNPGRQLAALPLKKRFEKHVTDYMQKQKQIEQMWPTLSSFLTEAERFEKELCAAFPS